jgi:iron complex outermembrane receptor protein
MKASLCLKATRRSNDRGCYRGVLCIIVLILTARSHVVLAADVLSRTISLDVPSTSRLDDALIEWGIQAEVTVMINTATANELVAHAVKGKLTAREALSLLLEDSGVTFTEDHGRVKIIPSDQHVKTSFHSERIEPIAFVSDSDGAVGAKNGDELTLSEKKDLTEVIVTAQKHEEKLQDVPVPVSEVSAASLLESNQLRIQDYFSQIPGLSVNAGANGGYNLAIRGISTGGNTNPTVAVLVDDLPVSPSSAVSENAAYVPDLDPSDLKSVEVLRGPQGTLYGASSLGGLIKYVTADPSTEAISGRVEVDGDWIHNGDGPGYGVRANVNLPITDTLAFRISGFSRKDPGYINDPADNSKGLNEEHVEGGRASLLWRPADFFSVKFSALAQDTTADGPMTALTNAGLGGLQQNYLQGTGPWDLHVHIYTANINAKFAGIDLTSITGYEVNQNALLGDLSYAFGPGIAVTNLNEMKKLSQEIRLSSSIGHFLDWQAGGFFTREVVSTDQGLVQLATPTTAYGGVLFNDYFPSNFREYAGFADFDMHFTDEFDLQLGGRESHNIQNYQETDTGPLVQYVDIGYNNIAILPNDRSTDSSFTYLITPRLKLSSDLMMYARVASGYRAGGPNANASLFGLPGQFAPDTTKNYEVGLKADFFDHMISFDGSVYYIDWKNVQIQVQQAGSAFFANAGGAKSQGVELSGQFRPTDGLSLDGWVAWDYAVLTSDFPVDSSTVGKSGDRLPYSSRFSGNLSVEERLPVTAELQAFLRGIVSYVGARESDFTVVNNQPRLEAPAYTDVNLLGGVERGPWALHVFLNNLADRRGIVTTGYFGNNADSPHKNLYLQPRTVGLSLAFKF